jgi:hypothetical protein
MIPQSEYLEEGVVILALQNEMGNVGLAAKELGLSRAELMDYMTRHPAVMETKRQIKEFIKDEAEDILVEKMRTDNSLLIFFLKTQAKDRGYETSHNTSNTTNVAVNVDARSLIAAMRSGANVIAQDEDAEDESEDSGLFTVPKLLDHRDGS